MIQKKNYGLRFVLFLMCLIEFSEICSVSSSSSSDVLIIRHGRSRVRHSTEKNHIRWGLQAFDNLTLYDYDYENPNGTNGSNDTIFDVNGIGNSTNQTSLGTEAFGYFSSETVNSNGGDSKGSSSSPSTPTAANNRVPNWSTMSGGWSTMSTSSTPKKKLVKKQIMESIRKNVEEGLEYLRTHAHLSQPTAMMPSEKSLRLLSMQSTNDEEQKNHQKQQQQQQPNAEKKTRLGNNNNQNSKLPFKLTQSSLPTSLPPISNAKLPKSPSNLLKQQQQQKQQTFERQRNEVKNEYEKPSQVHFDFNMQNDDANNYEASLEMHQQRFNNKEKPHTIPLSGTTTVETIPTAATITNSVYPTAAKTSSGRQEINDKLNLNGNGLNANHYDGLQNEEINPMKYSVKEIAQTIPKTKASTAKPGQLSKQNSSILLGRLKSNDKSSQNKFEPSGLRASHEQNDENDNSDDNKDDDDDDDNNDVNTNQFPFDSNNGNDENERNINFDINNENSNDITSAIYRMEDIDLVNLDETYRNNRLGSVKGRDIMSRFLHMIETQHLLGANCTAGTSLHLGEGVVDRYAQDRFRVEAEVAVNRANMLTRIFKLSPLEVQSSEPILHASLLSMIEFDDDIFAAGNCYDWNRHLAKKGLFCPYAYRLPPPDQGATLVKDLAAEYHYLGNTSEWFFQARKNAEKVIAKNEQYTKAYHLYSTSTQREMDEILSVKYEDGRWSKPYYDCGGGNIWMLTYTVPFFGYENGTYFFKGTSGIDIDLRRVDIDQCPQRQVPGGVALPLNVFAGSDKCKQRTTECEPIAGLGFRRGSYKCVCRKGFFFPDTSLPQKYYNGSTLEEEHEKFMRGEVSLYNDENTFECLPCAEGCDACKDASPCVAALNWPMRTSILVLACAVIGFLPPAAWFTFRYQQVKVLRAASPALLRVIALGAFFIYCTSLVMYPPPSIYTCTARVWLREIGFSLTYGALMLKTWRISVVFRVRSAKAVKITDATLLKRLGVICLCVGIGLLVRTIVAPPVVIVGRTADDLKAYLCKADWWDHTFTSMEVLFLAWGVRLCIMVRKAPSEFNESRFISMAIYNEFFLTCFLNVSMLFLQSPANPDLLYIIFFCHTQLTVTLLLVLIFGSKVYLVFRSGGKPPEDSMGLGAKSSGAKFICRSQARPLVNNPYPSTATSSTTPHGTNIEHRLTEQEALEEIRLLIQNFTIELQSVRDRVPARSSAMATIGMLLDNCKLTSNLPTTSLMPPPSTATSISGGGVKKSGIILNSTSLPSSNKNVAVVQCVDKSTNTNTISTAGNGVGNIHFRRHSRKYSNQKNGTAALACTTQISITDVCDSKKQNEVEASSCQKQLPPSAITSVQLPIVDSTTIIANSPQNQRNIIDFDRNKDYVVSCASDSGDGGDKQFETESMQCRNKYGNSRELSFLNLKLRCMCSGDDGSENRRDVGSDVAIAKSTHAGDCTTQADNNNDDVDDEDGKGEMEISNVEAITEIGETILENHRCNNCGQTHCCFFLRCCYCTANTIRSAGIDPGTLHENNPCRTKCSYMAYSNSVQIWSHLSSCSSSNKNLVDKYCDEICKVIRDKHQMGLCSIAAADSGGSSTTVLSKKPCCDDDDVSGSDTLPTAAGCHCQWFCMRTCDYNRTEEENVENIAQRQKYHMCMMHAVNSLLFDKTSSRCCRCLEECAKTTASIVGSNSGHKSMAGNVSKLNSQQQQHHQHHLQQYSTTDSNLASATKTAICNESADLLLPSLSTALSAPVANAADDCPQIDSENKTEPLDSSSSSNAASTTKRNKPSDKLVLDLNDRSKYTKEVSV